MDATTAQQGSGALFPMPQQQIPAAQLLPPPPPPSSLSSLSLSSSASSYSRHAPSITNFPILVLTVLGILTTSLLLLAYYVFVIRCCLNWHHRGGSSSSSSTATTSGGRGRRQRATTSSLPVSAAAPADEPRGLDEAAIRALPAFRYSSRKKDAVAKTPAAPASECAVCLGEFDDGDTVRVLPGCLHVFHVACIDTWLQGNANCPLCRADIATHCLRLPPLQPPADQLLQSPPHDQLVPAGAQQEDQATTQAQQRQPATAPAPETAGEPAATAAANHQLAIVVDGEQRKSITACCHEIGIGSKVDDERTAESKDGGEVHLQIHNILQGNDTRSSQRDDDSNSSSSSSVFSLV